MVGHFVDLRGVLNSHRRPNRHCTDCPRRAKGLNRQWSVSRVSEANCRSLNRPEVRIVQKFESSMDAYVALHYAFWTYASSLLYLW
eukprot:COSAG03_NODE_1188_length_4617_cov_2.586985_3_plen_86_part_00